MAEKDGRYNLTIAIHNTARIILKKKIITGNGPKIR